MIAISDIGGSKGDWGFVTKGADPILIETPGFNPFANANSNYAITLKKELNQIPLGEVFKVYYYGTGCKEESSKVTVRNILKEVFPNAQLVVDIDLLASARATCGHHKGIACILGTGANSGLYDGRYLIDNLPTLGYMAGDEGSGAYFGKLLIKSYFYREMPDDIRNAFEVYNPGKHESVLKGLYHNPPANQYLASFTKFASLHLDHAFIINLLEKSFQDFIDTQLCKYEGYQLIPANFVGSVAYYFQDILKACLHKNEIKAGIIIPKPISHLIQYHLEDENH